MTMLQRVLWAEDQKEFVDSLRDVLARVTAELIWVDNAADAEARVAAGGIDLMLLDLQMPPGDWGGLEFLKKIDVKALSFPIVVVSGAGTLTECVEAMRRGASQYVEKERARDELERLMHEVVQKAREARSLSSYALVKETEKSLREVVLGMAWDIAGGDRDRLFRQYMPRGISLKTYERWLDEEAGEQEDFLDVLDYATLIKQYWGKRDELKELERVLTPRRAEDRIQWLIEFNDARRVVAHATRGEINQQQSLALTRAADVMREWRRRLSGRKVQQ